MSNAAQSWAWQQTGLLSSDKIVLVALADNAWEDGSNAWPSVGLLVKKTGLCRRTVQTALRRLAEAGRIGEQAPAVPNKAMPTTYRLNMEPCAVVAPPGAVGTPDPRATAAPPGASDAPDPAHLTTEPRAAAAPELSTNQLQLQPKKSKDVAPRPDVEWLCVHLADRVEGHGAKRPPITVEWRTQARLLLDNDERDETQAHRLIDWAHDHEFWSSNVLSMPKFRKQYDQMLLQARRDQARRAPQPGQPSGNMAAHLALVQQMEAAEQNGHYPQGEIGA